MINTGESFLVGLIGIGTIILVIWFFVDLYRILFRGKDFFSSVIVCFPLIGMLIAFLLWFIVKFGEFIIVILQKIQSKG